jgi:hypothetical protein
VFPPAPFLVGVVGLGGNHAIHIIDPLKNIYQRIGGGYILETGTDDIFRALPKKYYRVENRLLNNVKCENRKNLLYPILLLRYRGFTEVLKIVPLGPYKY